MSTLTPRRTRSIVRAQRRLRPRRAMAALELVLATGITMPVLVLLLVMGIRASRFFFSLAGTMIGSPFM